MLKCSPPSGTEEPEISLTKQSLRAGKGLARRCQSRSRSRSRSRSKSSFWTLVGRSYFRISLSRAVKPKADGISRPLPIIGHVYRNSADIFVEGTVCPISFVKDVLVSSFLYPSPDASVLGHVKHATPQFLSQRSTQIRITLIEIHGQRPLQIICNCRLELQHCCNRSLSWRSLWSLVGHLELHKCCYGEEAFHDSSHQSLSACFGPEARAGVARGHQMAVARHPTLRLVAPCILEKRVILRDSAVWSMKICIFPRDIIGGE